MGEVRNEWLMLTSILRDFNPLINKIDKVVWWRNGESILVKNSYGRIFDLKCKNLVLDAESLCVLSSVWKTFILNKVKLFGGRFILNSLPTKSELCKRGMAHLLNNNLCMLFQWPAILLLQQI